MKYLAAFLEWSCCRRCGFVAKQKLTNLLNFGLKMLHSFYLENEYPHLMFLTINNRVIIPRRIRRDIVLAASVRPFRPSVHTFCPSGTISQYLLVRFDQMISIMDSGYPISLVKIDPLTLELLPLFLYRQL